MCLFNAPNYQLHLRFTEISGSLSVLHDDSILIACFIEARFLECTSTCKCEVTIGIMKCLCFSLVLLIYGNKVPFDSR
jgi:hypothetical protein